MSEFGTRIVHIMLFGAASIDVVITRVLYICTACIAATTPTTIQCFFLLLVCDLVYRETAGCCFSFFRSFTSSFNLYIFSCLLFTYFFRERSFLTILSLYSYFEKSWYTFFCGTFFALCSALVYISSIPVLHQIRTASSSRLSLCVIYVYVVLFRRLFHFYFVPTSNFSFDILDVLLWSRFVYAYFFWFVICLFNNNLLSLAQIYVDHRFAERY